MNKALFFCLWLLGALLTVAIFVNSVRKSGELSLEELLIGIVTSLFSFFGIVFVALYHLCEIVAEKYGNPIVWQRKNDE